LFTTDFSLFGWRKNRSEINVMGVNSASLSKEEKEKNNFSHFAKRILRNSCIIGKFHVHLRRKKMNYAKK
jgi:hypothetical protein